MAESCRTCALYDLDALRDRAGRIRAKGAVAKCGWESTETWPASIWRGGFRRPTPAWMGADDGADCACWKPRAAAE